MRFRQSVAVCAAMLFSQAAYAGEFVFGFGVDDILDVGGRESLAVLVEYHSDPFFEHRFADVSFLGNLQVDGDGDTFAGVGITTLSNFGSSGKYFAEFSLAVGPYQQGSGDGSGIDDFLLRSSMGIGIRVSDRTRVSLSLDHLLNSDFKNYEPGSETLLLRISRSY